MTRLSKRQRVAVGLIVLYVVLVAAWATRPLHETMLVGTDVTPTLLTPPQAAQEVRVEIECNNVFASSPGPAEPLPELTPQPEGVQPLAYPRPPCTFVQSDARRTLALDGLFLVIAAAGLVYFHRRSGAKALAGQHA